jgi:hypothetical protein
VWAYSSNESQVGAKIFSPSSPKNHPQHDVIKPAFLRLFTNIQSITPAAVAVLLFLTASPDSYGFSVPKTSLMQSREATTQTRRGHPTIRSTTSLHLDASLAGNVLGTIGTFYKESPVEAAFLTCGIKAASSDAIAQRAVEQNNGFAFKRNAAFIAYGGLYQGIAQYYIFNKLFPLLFGDGTDVITVAERSCLINWY